MIIWYGKNLKKLKNYIDIFLDILDSPKFIFFYYGIFPESKSWKMKYHNIISYNIV